MDEIEIAIPAEKLFRIFNIDITNTFLLAVILGGFIFLLFYFGMRKKRMALSSFQNFVEWILESLLNFFDKITGDRKKTEEILPLSATLFILVLFSNLLEIVPGLGVFPFLRSPSSDLNFTLALALISIFTVNIMALQKSGLLDYSKKFLNFKNPILFFVGILEGTGEITRVLSLAIRLFGNIFGGEVLLLVVSSFLPFFLPLPFLGFEIFVGFIQAMVFSTLVTIFYVVATAHHESEQ